MTQTPYLEDSTVREFSAPVERTLEDRVVLDRTYFYPEGGGQPADHGTLSTDDREWEVVDVQKKDTIYHTLQGPALPEPGTAVRGRLDWERRYGHMRHHTAQHLLSAHLLEAYDARTTGNQVHADRARIDVAKERFDDDELAAIQERLNDLVGARLPVRWYEMNREKAERELDTDRTRIDLLPDGIRTLRIVEIGPEDGPYDRTACAGTHVENTGDIGQIEITGRETKGSDEERLRFTARIGEERRLTGPREGTLAQPSRREPSVAGVEWAGRIRH